MMSMAVKTSMKEANVEVDIELQHLGVVMCMNFKGIIFPHPPQVIVIQTLSTVIQTAMILMTIILQIFR